MQNRKNIVILGSTGTIGINTLKVVERFPKQFKVLGLTAYQNVRLLRNQVHQFAPKYVAAATQVIPALKRSLKENKVIFLPVETDLPELVSLPEADLVVIGIRGSAALEPFFRAVQCGKTVAPANKEALVVAGDILMQEATKHNARIIPVDSEQSAIFQCLEGRLREELKKVYLTASGGPLRDVPKQNFDKLSLRAILNHPRWKMGKKITVDSATLMNKGFEVIEAQRLFQLNGHEIEVLIHPEAIIHSMVGFKDGTIMAQLGVTDMRLPIQYALTHPRRMETGLKEMNFTQIHKLSFDQPDYKKFPALRLAMYTSEEGGTLPCVLNAADEIAVEAFLAGRIIFSKIYKVVENVVLRHKMIKKPSLKEIYQVDAWARQIAKELI